MPEVNNSCLKCKGETEQGFVPDTVSATVHHPPSWIEGLPEPDSFFSGYAGRRMRTVNKVMRCKTCGYLEYYASDELLYV